MQAPYVDWIARYAERQPTRPAVHDLASDRCLNYRRFDARIDALAYHLVTERGVRPGARVAILAYNTSDIFELQFACWRIGALFLPLNFRLAPPELEAILKEAEPSLLVLDRALSGLLPAPPLPVLITDGLGGDSPYEDALRAGAKLEERVSAGLFDTAGLMFTAGTTGQPKGARITHAMNFYNAVNLSIPARITRDSIHLAAMPLFHTGGLNCYANVVFHAGGLVRVMRTWDPALALGYLGDRALGITHFFGVPAHYLAMAELETFARAELRLTTAGVGGAPCPVAMLERWSAKGVPIQQGYGLTESGPTVLVLDTEDAARKLGSAGLPALHVEVELHTRAGERIDEPEVVGEIWVRGPGVTPGYYGHDPLPGGWLKTGDAARRDADGYYFIVDRWKDMFISGGENVYPAEVENVLYRVDGVVEAAVIGVPDERWGEVGRAFVVRRTGSTLDADVLLQACRGSLAKYKVPRSIVFLDALPKNAAGKIHKRALPKS